jgi:dTDP-4-amino-4,6-dideoxygalactose transaminase
MTTVGPPIPLYGIYHDAAMEQVAAEVLRSGQIASGSHVEQFETQFGALIGSSKVVTVNDMSNAIQIAFKLAGVQDQDDVLTTSYACMSTNAPIATAGARPIWVDVDPQTGAMDPQSLLRSITPASKAVLLYHPAGYPAQVKRIAEICQQHRLKLIEDCDNALLARAGDQFVGSYGDYAIYSFYPNRHINATAGGALVCRDASELDRAKRLRRYGIDMPNFRAANGEINPHSDIAEIGFASTLNNLCAAIGKTQLGGVAQRIAKARSVAQTIAAGIAGLPGIAAVKPLANTEPSYWALLLLAEQRDLLMARLKAAGVQCSKLHHRTDAYSGFKPSAHSLPGTAQFMNQVLAIPCGWWLDDHQVNRIIENIKEISMALQRG